MLSTLLEIGRVFRLSNDLKYHRFVKRAPQRGENRDDKKVLGNSTRFFIVPVAPDGSFVFLPSETIHEPLIQSLFYLNYKTSDADTYKKYVFGDIYKLRVQQGSKLTEDGNFRFGDDKKSGLYRLNSFDRGKGDAESLENEGINRFRQSFAAQMSEIEAFMAEHENLFLHFDFAGVPWHRWSGAMDAINEKLIQEFIRPVENDERGVKGFVLRKSLYKTLTSASEGPSGRVPRFTAENEYKNKIFDSTSDVMDLLYVIDYSTKAIIRKGDVKIVVLPRGEGLGAEEIEKFFVSQPLESSKPTERAQQVRDEFELAAEGDWLGESMFDKPLERASPAMVQFDFVFSKAGSGPASADVDLVEIAGLDRGLLEELSKRAVRIRREVEKNRPKSDKIKPLSIVQSFYNVLADTTTAKKKYHGHLFSVLPQIYTGTYYRDDVVLPALIEKTEFNIRNDQANFGLLKHDFYFLTKLLNCVEDRLMGIQDSQSYQVGKALGRLAHPLGGSGSPIKSFEKNYAGLLSRRIAARSDVMKLGNDIIQKLVMHESEIQQRVKNREIIPFSFSSVDRFIQEWKILEDGQVYDKDECALGFFESYFARVYKQKEAAEPETGESNDSE